MHINFTIATEKDIPEILDMMEAFNAIDHYPFRRDKTRKNLMEFLANPSLGRLWLINHDNLTVIAQCKKTTTVNKINNRNKMPTAHSGTFACHYTHATASQAKEPEFLPTHGRTERQ